MGKSTNDPLKCADLDEVASVEISPGMKVMCTKLSLHALDLSYTQIVELALEIEKEFPSVQSYVTYPSSLYLTFSTYLDSDSIQKIKRLSEIRVRTNTVRNKGRELIV